MKRLFDIFFGLLLFFVFIIPMIVIAISVAITSKGPVFHWSDRVGKNNSIFRMPKFRSMIIDAPNVASHKIKDPNEFVTPIGSFLRQTSLDELPQLISILKGDMSFVGPRPALFNQDDLVALRKKRGVDKLTPGITGWAQINGRDNLKIPQKVFYDEEYLFRKSFWFDLKILWKTILIVFKKDNVSH